MSNNRKINDMSIIDILNYSNIARSTLYQWIHKYAHIQAGQKKVVQNVQLMNLIIMTGYHYNLPYCIFINVPLFSI